MEILDVLFHTWKRSFFIPLVGNKSLMATSALNYVLLSYSGPFVELRGPDHLRCVVDHISEHDREFKNEHYLLTAVREHSPLEEAPL